MINRGLAGKGNGREKTGGKVRIEIAKGRQACRQKTVGKSIVMYGMGLFSGVKTGIILLPMPPDTGIIFEQVPEGERIPAFIDYVYSSGNASSIKGKSCTIRTIEHLMAACHMYGITNLLVKVSDEVPIFDGSAREICTNIEEAGITEQNQGIEPLVVGERVELPNLPGDKYLSIEPAEEFEIDYTLDQPRPIGKQRYVFKGGKEAFLREIAPARTFGSIKDFERLEEDGACGGEPRQQRHE